MGKHIGEWSIVFYESIEPLQRERIGLEFVFTETMVIAFKHHETMRYMKLDTPLRKFQSTPWVDPPITRAIHEEHGYVFREFLWP